MIELGARQEREPVFAALLNAFERRYRQAGETALHDAWTSRLNTIDKDVTVTLTTGETIDGRAVGVNDTGALIVQNNDGEQRAFIAGEVTLREATDTQ